jgi:hypothetical protein
VADAAAAEAGTDAGTMAVNVYDGSLLHENLFVGIPSSRGGDGNDLGDPFFRAMISQKVCQVFWFLLSFCN